MNSEMFAVFDSFVCVSKFHIYYITHTFLKSLSAVIISMYGLSVNEFSSALG